VRKATSGEHLETSLRLNIDPVRWLSGKRHRKNPGRMTYFIELIERW
jgi:hypothetical protein